jgi:hypothetical protein
MVPERYPVRLVSSTKGEVEGEFIFGERVPSPSGPTCRDHVTLTLRCPIREITRTASDYFEALARIREELECDGWRPVCYGNSRNVYPSGMSRDMGMGKKAYKMRLGQRAARADLVKIFDSGPDVEPSSVDEQKQFHREWLQSLGFKPPT